MNYTEHAEVLALDWINGDDKTRKTIIQELNEEYNAKEVAYLVSQMMLNLSEELLPLAAFIKALDDNL